MLPDLLRASIHASKVSNINCEVGSAKLGNPRFRFQTLGILVFWGHRALSRMQYLSSGLGFVRSTFFSTPHRQQTFCEMNSGNFPRRQAVIKGKEWFSKTYFGLWTFAVGGVTELIPQPNSKPLWTLKANLSWTFAVGGVAKLFPQPNS